jgi:hypothetical protein
MSFQTFTDTAGGKILPKYLPTNASATSVIQITQGGNTPIRKPTVNNEQLTIIEQTQGGGTFTVNTLANPPVPANTNFVYYGAVPFNTGADFAYYVWGNIVSNVGGAIQNGIIYVFIPNTANPSAGVWSPLAFTNAGATIWSGCVLEPTTANGGRPTAGQTYAFAGDFTQITDAVSGAVCLAASGLVSYVWGGLFNALPLTAGAFSNAPLWSGASLMVGVPQPLVATVGQIIMINFFDLIQGATNFGSIVIYDGGAIKRIGGNVADIIPSVYSAVFDTQNRLWIGGSFTTATINGAAITPKALLCLSAAAGVFSNVVALPFTLSSIGGQPATIQTVSNNYNATAIVINGGYFQVAALGGLASGMAYISVANLAIQKFANIDSVATDILTTSLMGIDDDTYITTFFQEGETALFGTEGGITATFAKGVVGTANPNIQTPFLFWNHTDIVANVSDLCYISFAYGAEDAGTDLYDAVSGAFLGAGGAVAVFQGGSKARYVRPDGSAGDAVSITFQNNFSTVQLIGDLANNRWDTIGTTGSIVFNDA